jgi:hypothetical protein
MTQKSFIHFVLLLVLISSSQSSQTYHNHYRSLYPFDSQTNNLCGTAQLSATPISIKEILQNHSTCLILVPVNYRVCLQLLEVSLRCNAMVYLNSRCTLYHRGDQQLHQPKMMKKHLVYNEKVHEITHNHPSLHYHLLDAKIDDCIPPPPSRPAGHDDLSEGTLQMNKCLSDKTTNFYHTSPSSWDDWLQLPLLGIVMAVTKDWMTGNKYEMDRITDHWNCYAKTHNYTFVCHSSSHLSPLLLLTSLPLCSIFTLWRI